jgi:uncharacterized protein (DUF2147 family)
MWPIACQRRRRDQARRLAAVGLLCVLPWHGVAAAGDIGGAWLTDDGASKVEISVVPAAGGSSTLSGKVVWLREPVRDGKAVHDANNADAALRERPILGLPILTGFRPGTSGHWVGGTVYAPRSGKSYPAELSLTDDGRLRLDVKAGLLSKTDYWTR